MIGNLRSYRNHALVQEEMKKERISVVTRSLGGLQLLLTFNDKATKMECQAGKLEIMKKWFTRIYQSLGNFKCKYRIGQVEIWNVPLKGWNNTFLSKVGNSLGRLIGFKKETGSMEVLNRATLFVSLEECNPIPEVLQIRDGNEDWEVSLRFKKWVDSLNEESFDRKISYGGWKPEKHSERDQQIQIPNDIADHINIDGTVGERLEEGRAVEQKFCMEGEEHLMLMDRESVEQKGRREAAEDIQMLCVLGQVDGVRASPSPIHNHSQQMDRVSETQISILNRKQQLNSNGQIHIKDLHQQTHSQEQETKGRDIVLYGARPNEDIEEDIEDPEGESQEIEEFHPSHGQISLNNNGEEYIRREVTQVIEEGINLGFNFNSQGAELER